MDSTDAIIDALKRVVPGLAATFGHSCEVVLHDYRLGNRSVVAVSGEVTGRDGETGMRRPPRGDGADGELNHVTRTESGRTVKSSTMPLRDGDGHVFGALCVNLDVTALRQAGDMLSDLAGIVPQGAPPATTFGEDFDEVLDAIVRAKELALAKPAGTLTRQERLPLLKALDERGLFTVRGAAPKVAARLGISRASLYTDLAECRS